MLALTAAVSVRNLTKQYPNVSALKGGDFEIHAGEVFGLLGPNGAGKTSNRSCRKRYSAPRAFIKEGKAADAGRAAGVRQLLRLEGENLLRAHAAGVMLVAGSDAGNLLVFHGPTIHRELQLWVAAGVPPAAALQAATGNAARLLRSESRIGLVAKDHEADLLIVDGNPLTDIATTERISLVVFKGERIRRATLFEDTDR